MNINLIYHNNSFNFDLRSDISISYLEDLASKLINKDKSSFELIYKDENLSGNKKSLLKDKINPRANEPIDIYINIFEIQAKQKKIFPKIKLFNNVITKTDNYESKNNNIFLNETEISQSLSENSINIFQNFSKNIKKKKKVEYTTQNKVFEEIFNLKDNELLSLLKALSQKIKEFDDILYKKSKNNNNKNNIELITYENNIINFKDKQIQFIKKLLNFFENKELSNLSSRNNDLDEFYAELNKYDNKNYLEKKQNKKNIDIIKKQLLSPISLNNEKNYSFSKKELPLIMNNNNKNPNKFLFNNSIKKFNNSEKTYKNEEEKKSKILFNSENNKIKIKTLYDKNKKNKLYFNINYKDEKNSKTIDDKNNKKNKN